MVKGVLMGLVLVLFAARARAAGLPDFEGPLSELLILAAAHPPRKAAPPPPPERVTDAATWARLLERARLRPTAVQEVRAGNTDYEVSVVVLTGAAADAGQRCPAEMSPRVSLFVARAVRGPGGEVYPARLTVQCVGAALTRQEASVDAGEDGVIRDFGAYDPVTDKILSFGKARLTPAQKARFDALVAGAVARLLD